MKLFLLSLILMTGIFNLKAQCDFENLNDSLMKQIESDEILLESYRVYLFRSDTSGSIPVSNFPVQFEKDTRYRIRIISDQINYLPGGIVQLV